MSDIVSSRKFGRKKAAVIIAGAVLCAAVFLIRFARTAWAGQRVLLCVSDALTEVGLGYVLWGIILYFSHKGALDGLFYLAHNIAEMFKRTKDEYISYADFVSSRSHKPGCFKTFIVFGSIMFAAGLAVMFIRYSLI